MLASSLQMPMKRPSPGLECLLFSTREWERVTSATTNWWRRSMKERKARLQPSRAAPSWTRALRVRSGLRRGSEGHPSGRPGGKEAADR